MGRRWFVSDPICRVLGLKFLKGAEGGGFRKGKEEGMWLFHLRVC